MTESQLVVFVLMRDKVGTLALALSIGMMGCAKEKEIENPTIFKNATAYVNVSFNDGSAAFFMNLPVSSSGTIKIPKRFTVEYQKNISQKVVGH